MNRNAILVVVGVIAIGAIGFAVFQSIKNARENKENQIMTRGGKIAIALFSLAVIGTASYFIIKKRKENSNSSSNDSNESNESVNNAPSNNVNSNSNVSSLKKTPFTNKTQGDVFRMWVNANYSDYAKKIDLDRLGSYDNSNIRQAWEKYGKEFEKDEPQWKSLKGNGVPKEILDIYNKRKNKGSLNYSGDNGQVTWVIETNTINTIDGENQSGWYWKLFNSWTFNLYSYKNFFQQDIYFFPSTNKLVYNGNAKKSDGKWYPYKRTFTGTDYYNVAYKLMEDYRKFRKSSSSNFSGDANLQDDLEYTSRTKLGLDLNIID